MDIRPVIMAGGRGTRFWPLSRENKPKQFLPIVSEKTMVEETVERLLPQISPSHIYTVANKEQSEFIQQLFPQIPEQNFLVEPMGKNTAPSLILASAVIYLQNPEAVVAALPADHLIMDPSLFREKLQAAAKCASSGDYLITLGIPPSYPATGYGYIRFSPHSYVPVGEEKFFNVQEFKEKPDHEKAKVFLKEGNYFWNSGMFLWRANIFAQNLQKYAPSFYSYWEKMVEALKAKDSKTISSLFQEIPSTSIDYALMEKARGILMSEGNFGWSDVGAWSSLFDIWEKDENANALRGENIVLDSHNCLLYSPHKLTALVGVKDMIVVDTEDVLLVCHKHHAQKVKDLVDLIKKKGDPKYL
ncbi:mannose-1-phosphate guanylyltransferase [bacterium]|nr:mannose-1-phosphate guanylyltransferase [bacterium]